MSINYYELAIRAAGVCPPGQENAYMLHVRNLAVRLQREEANMSDFLADLDKARNKGGEKNGNKGWGVFKGTILNVRIDERQARRAFIKYSYMGKVKNHDGSFSDALMEDEIRTEPTAKPEAQGLFVLAQTLIGHDVSFYKRPDPDFDDAKVNAGRPADDRIGAPKTVFHIEDLGRASTPVPAQRAVAAAPAKSVEAQRPAPQAPAQQAQGAPQGQQQAPQAAQGAPAGADETKAAKTLIWSRLTQGVPQAPQQVLAEAATAGWNAIGNPTTAPSEAQVEQATQAAFAYLNQAAAAAGAARA